MTTPARTTVIRSEGAARCVNVLLLTYPFATVPLRQHGLYAGIEEQVSPLSQVHKMKTIVRVLPLASLLLFPLVANAQKAGLITCARTEAYAYLYSSVTTMEISTTLKCGQAVRILDRSDNFVHVRTENGDDGFVPLSSVTFVKNGAVLKAAPAPAQREI